MLPGCRLNSADWLSALAYHMHGLGSPDRDHAKWRSHGPRADRSRPASNSPARFRPALLGNCSSARRMGSPVAFSCTPHRYAFFPGGRGDSHGQPTGGTAVVPCALEISPSEYAFPIVFICYRLPFNSALLYYQ